MILGIDLGTKNSLIGFYDGDVNLIKNNFGEYMTPSVVHIDENHNVIVGSLAKQRLLTHPNSTFEMFKRDIGTNKTVSVNHKSYTATELSSFVLSSLVNDFKAQHDCEIEGVVISVPAYFNENQRYETKRAGQLIGLNVIQVLNEPSAAALYANQYTDNFDKSMILDLGGGTFDITIVECFEQVYEIISIAGDTNLGGQDYTNAIVELFCQKTGTVKSPQLEEICEIAKQQLTDEYSSVEIEHQGKNATITFEEYYRDIESINSRIYPIFYKAIQDAKISDVNEIKNIIFIGGGSKMYAFRKYIHDLLSANEEHEIFNLENDCDLTVARGVVLYTGMVNSHENVSGIVLLDVCPFSLGVAIIDHENNFGNGKKFDPIISRNETLPTTKTHFGSPVSNKQKIVNFKIYQGESLNVENNLLLGTVTLPCDSETNLLVTTFTYDINSILKIKVRNTKLNVEEEIYLHHHEDIDENSKNKLIKQINSLEHVDRKLERQKFYIERLLYLYEHGNIEQREISEELLNGYRYVIDNGTYKEQRLFEDRIDKVINRPINLTVTNQELIS